MRTYNVYRHPVHGAEAVKVGFSWPALFFFVIWMIAKRLWRYALAFFLMNTLLNASGRAAEQNFGSDALAAFYVFSFVVSLALWLVPAFEGNKWREADLRRRGYVLSGTLHGSSPDAGAAQAVKTQ